MISQISAVNFFGIEAAVRRCSSKLVFLKFGKFYWKTPVLESRFNKAAGQAYNFIKKRLQHRCFSLKFAKF